MPLCVDQRPLPEAVPAVGGGDGLRVLWVTSFIPLHGAEVVAGALARLGGDPRFRFTVIGDGQTADAFAAALGPIPGGVTWHRSWMDAEGVRAALVDADVCLGVFGTTPKAGRVWPYKNQLALCHGRALISRTVDDGVLPPGGRGAYRAVPPGDVDGLVAALEGLLAPAAREDVVRRGFALHAEAFDNRLALDWWRSILGVGLPAPASGALAEGE